MKAPLAATAFARTSRSAGGRENGNDRPPSEREFIAGGVIYAVNGKTVEDMASLGAVLGLVVADSPLILQVERSEKMQVVVFKSE